MHHFDVSDLPDQLGEILADMEEGEVAEAEYREWLETATHQEESERCPTRE